MDSRLNFTGATMAEAIGKYVEAGSPRSTPVAAAPVSPPALEAPAPVSPPAAATDVPAPAPATEKTRDPAFVAAVRRYEASGATRGHALRAVLFDAHVDDELAAGKSRGQAYRSVITAYPSLHDDWVHANRGASAASSPSVRAAGRTRFEELVAEARRGGASRTEAIRATVRSNPTAHADYVAAQAAA